MSEEKAEVTDEQKQKTFLAFKTHQIPNLLLFGSAILFGAALVIFSGFTWLLLLLLPFGSLIPSILALVNSETPYAKEDNIKVGFLMSLMKIVLFLWVANTLTCPLLLLLGFGFSTIFDLALANSILCMEPLYTNLYYAKLSRNLSWATGGAILITSGVIFCSGLIAFSLITFGSLGIVSGILKAVVGSSSDFINAHRETVNLEKVDKDISEGGVNSFKDIHWIIWIYKIFNILAFLGTGTLGVLLTLAPISLPFFPLVGIGIAALSVLGVVKSVLHLFLDNKASHVKCYKAAKYFKCGIFILGGAALIALAFLPITTALAGIIGTPAILLKIACPVIGSFAFLKGVISCRYNYSRNECMLVVKELERIYGKSESGSITEKLSKWPRPKIDGDINFNSLDKAFRDYVL